MEPVVDLDEVLAAAARESREASSASTEGLGALTLAQLSRLPASVGLLDAARAVGIGRTTAYQLARDGQFPCPLIKVGAHYRVPTAGLLRLLGLTPPAPDRENGRAR